LTLDSADIAYTKIVVTWDWTPEAKAAADAAKPKITLWDFRQIMNEIAQPIHNSRSYFTDNTLRTLGLFARVTSPTKGS
jgi:hypothetical protein